MTANGELDGRVGIVTGAGQGMGRAVALRLSDGGASLVVNDVNSAAAESTCTLIAERGGEAVAAPGDVTSSAEVRRMVEAATGSFGGLHVLVNNCGIGVGGTVADLDEAVLERSLDINLKSAVFASKHAIPHMRVHGGSIINVSSIDGITAGMAINVPYGIAKGALHMLTRTTAAYHGREGIRANCIAPGHLHAAFTGHFPERTRDLRRRAAPLGTEGTAWDIAWAAVFLASDESRWISGVVLPVDGGLMATAPLTAYGYIENIEYWQRGA